MGALTSSAAYARAWARVTSPWLRLKESRLSYSTASKPSRAQRAVQRPMIRARAARFAVVRMSSSHSPHTESTTGLPWRLRTSDQCRCQNRFSFAWVWKPLT